MRGKSTPKNSRDWASRKCVPPIQTQREVESDQDGLMNYGTCPTLLPAVRLSSWIFLDLPRPPSLRCTESEDSSDLSSENFTSYSLCFFPTCFFLWSHVLHIVINGVCVQTLPTAQATPALTDSFSRGHDPFAHACKARPLTIVGWISLSVIVIVIVETFSF